MYREKIMSLIESNLGQTCYRMLNLNEATFTKVNEKLLEKLFEDVADKSNKIDFAEIEKSRGNIEKFKYTNTIYRSTDMLLDIYRANPEEMKLMSEYVEMNRMILNELKEFKPILTEFYDDAVIAILYNTTVANVVYSTTLLSTATVRFLSGTEGDDAELILDSIPNPEKNIFLKNTKRLKDFWFADAEKFFNEYRIMAKKKISETFSMTGSHRLEETFVMSAGFAVAITVGSVLFLFLLLNMGTIIRECIYGVLGMRMRIAKCMDYQIELINLNIDALTNNSINMGRKESDRTNRIIVKQRKIVDKLTGLRDFFMVKFEENDRVVANELKKENRAIGVDELTKAEVMI